MARRRWKIDDIKSVLDGVNPFIQFGYDVVEPHHRKIGEKWTDVHGKTWEQKNGYRVIVNEKADAIRDMVRQKCAKCEMDIKWGNRMDRKFFSKSGMCYNCTIDHDTMLRLTGKWDTYEKKKVLSSQLSYLKDIRGQIKESINFLKTTDGKLKFVDEAGRIETWTDNHIDVLLKGAETDYGKLTMDIEETEQLIATLEEV